jgi:bile acid-coenzyme A ligase
LNLFILSSVTIMSTGARIAQLARLQPDAAQVTCAGRTFSRRQFDRMTNRAARQLAAMGGAPGSFISIALPNGIPFLAAAVAAWKIGAVPQPLSYRLPDVERNAILDLVRPSVLLREHFEVSDAYSGEPLPDVVAPAWKAATSGGSTGRPKVIVDGRPGLTDPNAPAPYHIVHQGVAVIPGPLYHTAPFNGSLQALLAGCHVVVMERFDPATCLAFLEQYRGDWVSLVPTMMKRILDLPDEVRKAHDLSHLQVLWHSGGPCPAWLKSAYIDWLGAERVWELYGATERQATTSISGTEWLAHRGSVGRPNYGEMRIVDDEGQPAPPGTVGLVQLRAPAGDRPTYRYLGAESVASEDGWDTVGDLGSLDDDGYLTLADRRTDLILRGGANVYPAECEAALESHPAVASCIVIGLPDDDLGERVHAVLRLRGPVTRGELVEHLSGLLARYKIPATYELVDRDPRDEAGKVRRSALRAERLDAGDLPGTPL